MLVFLWEYKSFSDDLKFMVAVSAGSPITKNKPPNRTGGPGKSGWLEANVTYKSKAI